MMIIYDLLWHLWLHFAILYEKLKISWESWEKEMRKIFEVPLISSERFKDLYQEYPLGLGLNRHHPYF